MLTFFRVYAFYHAIALLLILLLIRGLFLWNDAQIPFLVNELEYILIGEKLATGDTLYKQVWASVSPLSGWVYWITYLIGERSRFAFQTIAALVTIIQFFYFNYALANRHAYLEKTYLPGLVYLVFMHLCFDFFILSPALLATTFLVFALGTLIKQLERREGISDEIYEAGIFIGIATLFHLPVGVYIFWLILSMLFFTGSSFRQYFLVIIGFLFPILIVFIYYFFQNNLTQLEYCWASTIEFINLSKYTLSNLKGILTAFTLPVVFMLLGLYQINQTGRYSNYQTRIQQIMFLWVVVGLIYFLMIPQLTPSQLIVFVPAFAFFAVHFFLNFRKRFIPDVLFLLFFLGVLGIGYIGIMPDNPMSQLNPFRLDETHVNEKIRNKKVLIIGDNISEYQYCSPATSYLSWDLARIDLQNPDSYESVINIFYNFKDDPPAYIIDKENVIPRIFKRLPALGQNYRTTPEKGMYERINRQ